MQNLRHVVEWYKRSFDEVKFAEEIFGIKLLPHQKMILKSKDIIYAYSQRRCVEYRYLMQLIKILFLKGRKMKEILGNNLEEYFSNLGYDTTFAELTYKGPEYEVWSVNDILFEVICNDKTFEKKNPESWWRYCTGSILKSYDHKIYTVNCKKMIGWDMDRPTHKGEEYYTKLSYYLCDYIGCSLPKNVCACAMDLAKMNNMTMGELFKEYEGY